MYREVDVWFIPRNGLIEHVEDWPVDQQISVGFAGLKDRLHARVVRVHRRHVPPDRVARVEFDRRVEIPAGPLGIIRRIAAAVIDEMIDPGEEHLIGFGLHLRERRAEMLAQPGKGFAGSQLSPRNVRRGRCEARDLRVGNAVLSNLGRFATEAGNRKRR